MISERIKKLQELRRALKEVKNKIRIEKRALLQNKKEKFILEQNLSKENRYAKKLNRAFSRGEESIDRNSFYTPQEQNKTR